MIGGFGSDHYVIEPTHEVLDHHFEEGCTIIQGLEEEESITFQLEDKSCILEVDAWELLWYIPELEECPYAPPSETWDRLPSIAELAAREVKPASAEVEGAIDATEVSFDNDCLAGAVLYRWTPTGAAEAFHRFALFEQDVLLRVQPGDVYSLAYDGDSDADICYCNCDLSTWTNIVDGGDNTYTIPSSGIATEATLDDVCDPYLQNADAPQLRNHFDVWLTPDGHTNICENKWN